MKLRYVNKDHNNPLYGKTGTCLVRSKGPGPRNQLVRLDDGQLVVAPWGNWRAIKEFTKNV